jgi:hypothetical protein
MSRHYLFAMWEGGGNVPPMLGVARRLIARGHAVTVLRRYRDRFITAPAPHYAADTLDAIDAVSPDVVVTAYTVFVSEQCRKTSISLLRFLPSPRNSASAKRARSSA